MSVWLDVLRALLLALVFQTWLTAHIAALPSAFISAGPAAPSSPDMDDLHDARPLEATSLARAPTRTMTPAAAIPSRLLSPSTDVLEMHPLPRRGPLRRATVAAMAVFVGSQSASRSRLAARAQSRLAVAGRDRRSPVAIAGRRSPVAARRSPLAGRRSRNALL